MLFETLLQGNIFLVMLYYGIISGIIFEAKNLIEKTFKDNKIICIIFDCAYMLICSLIFVSGKNMSNYGETRIYLLIAFFIGIVLEHISIGFLVEKIFLVVYNSIVKVFEKIKFSISSKVKQKREKQLQQRTLIKNNQNKSNKSHRQKKTKSQKQKNKVKNGTIKNLELH